MNLQIKILFLMLIARCGWQVLNGKVAIGYYMVPVIGQTHSLQPAITVNDDSAELR